MDVSNCCTLYKGDFKSQREFESVNSIFDHPKVGSDDEIVESFFSVYNSWVLQTICNIRNQSLCDGDSSETKRKVVSAICAASMVSTAVTIGLFEVVARLAIAIIFAPGFVSVLWKGFEEGADPNRNDWVLLSCYGGLTAVYSVLSSLEAFKCARDCFNANVPVCALINESN